MLTALTPPTDLLYLTVPEREIGERHRMLREDVAIAEEAANDARAERNYHFNEWVRWTEEGSQAEQRLAEARIKLRSFENAQEAAR